MSNPQTFIDQLNNSNDPTTAPKGWGYFVTWADGRGKVGYRHKQDAVDFISQDNGDPDGMDVVEVKYRKAEKSERVRNKFTQASARTYMRMKIAWDNPPRDDATYPGSNVSGPVPHSAPKSPGSMPRKDQGKELGDSTYFTPSIIDREPEENHQKTEPTGQSDSGQNAPDDDPWGPSNKLRKVKPNQYRPFDRPEFNEDYSEYTQRQFGSLNMRRVKIALNMCKVKKIADISQQDFFDFYGLASLPQDYVTSHPDIAAYYEAVMSSLKDEYLQLLEFAISSRHDDIFNPINLDSHTSPDKYEILKNWLAKTQGHDLDELMQTHQEQEEENRKKFQEEESKFAPEWDWLDKSGMHPSSYLPEEQWNALYHSDNPLTSLVPPLPTRQDMEQYLERAKNDETYVDPEQLEYMERFLAGEEDDPYNVLKTKAAIIATADTDLEILSEDIADEIPVELSSFILSPDENGDHWGPWGEIAQAYTKLKNAQSPFEIMQLIDLINSLQHNDGLLFEYAGATFNQGRDKYDWIKSALDFKFTSSSQELLSQLSSPVQKFLYDYLQLHKTSLNMRRRKVMADDLGRTLNMKTQSDDLSIEVHRIVSQWVQTAEAAGLDEVLAIFADRTNAYNTVMGDLKNKYPDDVANMIAIQVIDTVPQVLQGLLGMENNSEDIGQAKKIAAMAVPIRESLDYPHSWNKEKKEEKGKDVRKKEKAKKVVQKSRYAGDGDWPRDLYIDPKWPGDYTADEWDKVRRSIELHKVPFDQDPNSDPAEWEEFKQEWREIYEIDMDTMQPTTSKEEWLASNRSNPTMIDDISGYDFGGADYPQAEQGYPNVTVVDNALEDAFREYGYSDDEYPYIQRDISSPDFETLEPRPHINVSKVLRHAGTDLVGKNDNQLNLGKLQNIATNIDDSLLPGGKLRLFDYESVVFPIAELLQAKGYTVASSDRSNFYDEGLDGVSEEWDVDMTLIKPTNSRTASFASILDEPRASLDPAIWDIGADDLPMLKPDVKIHIIENFMAYVAKFGGYIKPEQWVKNMFYTGSTATHTYNDTSDVDIHIIVDWIDLAALNSDKAKKDPNEMWRELHDVFWWTLNKIKLPGTKHPLTYYVMPPGDEKKLVDQKEELYDMGHDVWIIPPGKAVNLTEEVIDPALEEAGEFMARINQHIADARRGVIDYALLNEVITSDNAANRYSQIADKLAEIDTELKALKDEYAQLKQKRQDAFDDEDSLVGGNSNYSLGNIIFKLVERYKYMDVLRKIKQITDDMDLRPDQVNEVAGALGLSLEE